MKKTENMKEKCPYCKGELRIIRRSAKEEDLKKDKNGIVICKGEECGFSVRLSRWKGVKKV